MHAVHPLRTSYKKSPREDARGRQRMHWGMGNRQTRTVNRLIAGCGLSVCENLGSSDRSSAKPSRRLWWSYVHPTPKHMQRVQYSRESPVGARSESNALYTWAHLLMGFCCGRTSGVPPAAPCDCHLGMQSNSASFQAMLRDVDGSPRCGSQSAGSRNCGTGNWCDGCGRGARCV